MTDELRRYDTTHGAALCVRNSASRTRAEGGSGGPASVAAASAAEALVFGVASAACAWAPNSAVLTAGRAAMGPAVGIHMPLSMSMLTRLLSERERSRAISMWTVAVALGITVGPLLGGSIQFRWGASCRLSHLS